MHMTVGLCAGSWHPARGNTSKKSIASSYCSYQLPIATQLGSEALEIQPIAPLEFLVSLSYTGPGQLTRVAVSLYV